jgi:transposase-like protein
MKTCPQCGKDMSNRGELVRYCSKGCENAYNRDNPNILLGLAGKAIGNAISGAKERKQEQAQQEEQRMVEREERRQAEAEEKAAASAARHILTHEVVCPICDADVVAKMASDGETKVRCKQCKTRLKVEHDGDVTVLGPKDEELSKAESLEIKEDRICSQCKHHLPSDKQNLKFWIRWPIIWGALYLCGFAIGWGVYWKIGGAILSVILFLAVIFYRYVLESGFENLCTSKEARSVTGWNKSDWINPNLRCKFLEKK